MSLVPPDSHYLSAAIGWLELGNADEAALELDQISAGAQLDPDVLEVKWTLSAKQENWERCIEIARSLSKISPLEAFGWIHLSYSLHELKRTKEAYDNLKHVLQKFPNEWLMCYNMACYACQLGNLDEAERWLKAASMKKNDEKGIKRMAESDPDLSPLFKKSK